MQRRFYAVLLAALAVSACVTTHAIQLAAPGRYPPVDAMHVQVFLNESDVKVPFEKIALIEAEGDYNMVDNPKMVDAMKKKAGKLGANAIILGEFKEPSTAGKVAQALVGVGGERKGQVVAIRLADK